MFENVIATTAVWNAHAKIALSVAWVLTPLLCTDPTVSGLFWLQLSHCTSYIVFENVIASTAVLTLMPKLPRL